MVQGHNQTKLEVYITIQSKSYTVFVLVEMWCYIPLLKKRDFAHIRCVCNGGGG